MKTSLSKLDRLFEAARKAWRQESTPILSPELANRIVARWRREPDADSSAFLYLILRRALYGAALVMVICLVWSYSDMAGPDADVALANYEVQNEVQFDPLL
jgi:hypothetical protein